ncbi:MAG: OmpA family protein [Kangiellaceae bacterium]|jgi:chemotaxis protein MotB
MRRIRNNIDVDEQEVGRWLISYADFITLLFAFFVVMYSISQVNVSKYKILSQSLEGVFDTPSRSTEIVPIGDPAKSLQPITGDETEFPEVDNIQQENDGIDSENFASTEEFRELESGLQASLGDLIDQDLAEINSDANWINVVLKSALLFPSGSDLLNQDADPLMDELAKHLNTNLQLILVHGHTDNIPINTVKFPSNWELSSARGVAVVRKLQNLGVQPNRLSVEGHGEYQPIADNATAAGRQQNRRVVISISRKQSVPKAAPQLDSDRTAANQPQNEQTGLVKEEEQKYEIIRLPGGGILIRGKESPENENNQ